jgi:hypothetical protein
MHDSNGTYLRAFPTALRDDARVALSVLPENPRLFDTFSVKIAGELVALPCRIYHDPGVVNTIRLTALQQELVHCLLTRHHDGFIRQHYLTRIIGSRHPWVCPFVVKLVGEYVIEILQVIQQNLGSLEGSMYRHFLEENPEFLAVTGQRVVSYWNCYYRDRRRGEYVGFQVLEYLRSLAASPTRSLEASKIVSE